MPIRAVMFDIGGVLVQQVDRSRVRQWETRLDLEEGSLGRSIWLMPISLQAEIGRASEDDVWAAVADRFELNPIDMAALRGDFFSGSVWNDRLIDYARSLRARYRTGIISNAWPEAREAVKPWVNGDAFDDLIFSAEVGLAKPDRRIYELALERLRVQPAEAIFIDDMPGNVEAAQAIGMAGIRFVNTEQTIKDIERILDKDKIMLAELEITTEYGLPEGYTLRGATLDDLPEAADMFNACSRKLFGTDEVTLEGYRREWEVPLLNLPEDVKVVIAPDGSIAGCQEVWICSIRIHASIHGAACIPIIGGAALRGVAALGRRACPARDPAAPEGARVAMTNWINNLDTAGNDVMLRSGFNLMRHSYRMRINLTEAPPAPVWPEGITLRPFDPDRDLEAVAWADREAFRDHWGWTERPFEQDLQMFRHWLTEPRFDPSLWFMAMQGDNVAGVCLCDSSVEDDAEMGWVGSLGVLRPYRKHGLGLALLRHSFGELYQRGRRKVGLGVDASNLTGALRLYEKVGMRVYRQNNTYEKELRPGVELSTQAIA